MLACPSATPAIVLVLRHRDFDAPVLGAAVGIVRTVWVDIGRHRSRLAKAARLKICGINAGPRNQPLCDHGGASFRKGLIILMPKLIFFPSLVAPLYGAVSSGRGPKLIFGG